MREIKFRAWTQGKMLIGSLEFWLKATAETGISPYSKVNIWMQYTGLKDKNGKEIYEGDIIKNKYGRIELVKYESYGFEFNDEGIGYQLPHDTKTLAIQEEVIGNIYENPELLK